jgi:fumarate hydratase class II
MTQFRIEKDSLGDVRVPADAWYGAQTQRAVDNFPISDLRFPRRFIEALGWIKQCAAEANMELGLLDRGVGDAIIEAAAAVARGAHDDQFVIDIFQTGSGTSTNMNANEVIANLATVALGGEKGDKHVHPNDHVNMSQSSNDTIPTAIHVSVRMAIHRELIPALERFRDALLEKAGVFDDVIKSGRTHLMDATPVRMGQEFAGYAAQISHSIDRVMAASDELGELAQGGTATGTGINVHPDFPQLVIRRLSERSGLEFREAENHFEAQAARDACVSTAGALNTVAVSLMKIVNDIRWMGSGPTSGIFELTLPAVQPGSSIMPGKVNPVLSEALMMVAARVMGNATTVTVCGQHGNFELNVMMPVLVHALLQSVSILAGATDAFREKCLVGLEANRDRCQELLERNPSIATALNRAIGYDRASAVAKKAAREKKAVTEVVREEGLLSEAEMREILDLRSLTEPGLPGE